MEEYREENQVTIDDLLNELEASEVRQADDSLNGFYFDGAKRVFVSFVKGQRHYETNGQGMPAEWKERIRRERYFV
ncbi:hypothetical protein J2T17_006817 [Paenibacillus mucilaginosus]|uniref:hypothetical protein n=1 Tax=Paenibacillus mucilaginosus TaxID=61624 RepID=UPI003D1E7564